MSEENSNLSREKKNKNDIIEEKSDEVLEVLPKNISELLEDVPKEKRERIKSELALSIQATYYRYRGPSPPPDYLKEIDEVIENGAERVFKKFEQQSDHRREIETKVITSQISQSSRGQVFGFTIGLVGLGLAFTAALLGHETFATILAAIDIVGLVSVFVIGKREQEKDLKEKK